MFLGIEIGGTKLQLGVGSGDGGEFAAFARHDIDISRGAPGILEQIEKSATALSQKHQLQRIGIGFGGPVDSERGLVTKSHQVEGWESFPLVRWCQETLGIPTLLGNDCDVASLAEARNGAGKGAGSVFYVTVGTGVGGGLVIGGKLQGVGRPAVAEIGHLRPGLHEDRPELTVESLCSGPAIAAAAAARITGQVSRPLDSLRKYLQRNSLASGGRKPPDSSLVIRRSLQDEVQSHLADQQRTEEEYIADLLARCGGNVDNLTAKAVAQSAAEGNEIACEVMDHACQVLGWALAQVITLVAPEVVVIGGGVSLIGEPFFFAPLRSEVARYVFPPLAGSFRLVPAALGELAVVHGAVALAAESRP
ncbi:MAG: ROK family protein [Pirellulaceae bacterium]|nr:ROK family protein [Pirellulaceae bacterium]